MHIEEKLLLKRISKNKTLYYRCNSLDDAVKIYRNNVHEFLQDSKVEIYCLHCIMNMLFQWYQSDWNYKKLYAYMTDIELDESEDEMSSDTVFDIDSSKIDEIRDNAELIESRLLEGVELEETNAEDEIKTDSYNERKKVEVQENVDDEWSLLLSSIKPEHRVLLRKIIVDNAAYEYLIEMSKEKRKLPEMVIEEINEMAIDIVGDTVVELGENELLIFDDYKEELRKYIC